MVKITFLPRSDVASMPPPPGAVLISIFDRSEEKLIPPPGWTDVLYLRFHDSDGSHLGLEQFSLAQAQEALDFVQRHLDAGQLVIHCHQGRSRSAALALFLAGLLGVPCFQGQVLVDPKYRLFNHRMMGLLWEALESDAGAGFRQATGT